jgi:hypothetical protein
MDRQALYVSDLTKKRMNAIEMRFKGYLSGLLSWYFFLN